MDINLNSKSVALLGKAFMSLPLAMDADVDEFWGVGTVYMKETPPLDRLYEIHKPDFLSQPAYDQSHWKALQAGIKDVGIIVMQDKYNNIPRSQKYPIEGVKALCTQGKRGEDIAHYFKSSFDYMMAAAILEGFERVEIYGFDLGSVGTQTEYIYQYPSASYWIGQAIGRGIDVYIPKESSLLSGLMYGYEGAQTVSSARVAQLRDDITENYKAALAELNESPTDKAAQVAINYEGALEALQHVEAKASFVVGGEAIAFRGMIEMLRGQVSQDRMTSLGTFNRVNAQLHERMSFAAMYPEDERIAALVDDMKAQHTRAVGFLHKTEGALQILERLVVECDRTIEDKFEVIDRILLIENEQ